MAKIIICRCEDVSLKDLTNAFESGQHDLESLKRYTGFSTGFCQGKSCLAHAARFLASLKGGDDVVSDPPRTRPLLHPTEAARFAGGQAQKTPTDESSEEK
ncbi:MAG: (2Fe-2S)-binding protein [Deltaproteobacteria bacterium]|nr:(2Fe-2S)-binding protein [Deltaproteobacteria bacterium]MBW1872043.1 (2Fe-2S)-binding protein [Deltaproteobacteria bacterium]